MNILVDSCAYNCQNAGDLAMLTVTVRRLRELWPDGTIAVITNAPDLIARHCGGVRTVPVQGRRLLLAEYVLGPLGRLMPAVVRARSRQQEDRLRRRWPSLFAASLRIKAGVKGRDVGDASRFIDAVRAADIAVVNGAGIITDAFKDSALGILETLDLVSRRGRPTAFFGQGFGPISDPDLLRRAAEVLPRVTSIAIRESRTSLPLLLSLGVSRDRIVVTGDDAIELAMEGLEDQTDAPAASRHQIGVNIRIAPYAGIGPDALPELKAALTSAAYRYGARMASIPIAHHGGRMDVETLRDLLDRADDGGASLDTPRKVIARIGECRIVITGSYHGAVFALAQGIPVVALAKSQYYVNKMEGLADQFGVGCEIVRFDADGLRERLTSAIDAAWTSADRVRAPLLAAAADQVRRSRAAYDRLRALTTPARLVMPTRTAPVETGRS